MGEFYLAHAGRSKRDGAKVGSGRYPLGSGDRPYQATGGMPRSKHRAKRPNLDHLSDEDMQKAIKRENLEKTYSNTFNLTRQTPEEKAQSYINTSKETIKALKKIEKMTRKKQKALDLSNKSNEEMQREIQRANLERQYNQLFNNEPNITKGRETVQKILDTAEVTLDLLGPFALLGAAYLGYRVKKNSADLFPWR